jgi:hypothetical protein
MSAQTLQAGEIKLTLPASLKPFQVAANSGLQVKRPAALDVAPEKTENSAAALRDIDRSRIDSDCADHILGSHGLCNHGRFHGGDGDHADFPAGAVRGMVPYQGSPVR